MNLLLIFTAILALSMAQRPSLIAEPLTSLPIDPVATTPEPMINATYWLAMSNKVRPGLPFQFSAQLLDGQSPVEVTIVFKDQKGSRTLLEPPPFTVNPGTVQTFSIDIPLNMPSPLDTEGQYWYAASYTVLVQGLGPDTNFKHTEYVTYEEKSFSTFLQTDKGMYKPGQKVLFRVLTVYPDMTAVHGEPYDIYIEDANGNRIRQWLGVQDPNGRGVVELWLQLADEVPTGEWTITAEILGKEEKKTFTVDNYVLPRFEVEVKLPSFALSTDSLMSIEVKATYTFGQPVTDGTVLMAIRHKYHRAEDDTLYKKGKLNKDGILTIEVAHKEILKMISSTKTYVTSLDWQEIKVEANVTETQTRRMMSGSAETRFYNTPIKMRFVDEVAPTNYKPGLQYTIYTEIRKQDDSLFLPEEYGNMTIYFNVTYEVPLSKEELDAMKAEDASKTNAGGSTGSGSGTASSGGLGTSEPLLVDARSIAVAPTFGQYYPSTKTVVLRLDEAQRTQKPPSTGWLTLTFDTPINATQLTVKAWSVKPFEVSTSKWLNKATSPSNTFLQMNVGTEKPKVGTEFKVTAISTEAMPALTYQIFAKGVLLETHVVPAPPNYSSSVEFSFMVTRMMTPTLSLVAFYVREENHEVVVDAQSLSVDGLFQSPMSIEFSKMEAEPGDKVDVTVKAATDSLVYLLSADKSAILLKGGNDITQEDVTRDMAEYSFGGGFAPWRFMFICGWPSPYGGSNAASVLRNAGVIFLSDVLVYSGEDLSKDRTDGGTEMPAIEEEGLGGGLPDSNVNGGSSDFTQADVVRKFFPEVWLWEISYITPDSGGQVVIPATVPDTLTTWITTGFSIHPDLGLSITEKPTELVVKRPMFVTLDLPMTIIRGENYCFTATVFSYYNGTLPIMVTLDKSDKFDNIHVGIDRQKVKLTTEKAYYSYFLGDVEMNEMRSVSYCFVPLELGDIPVKVSALTTVQGLSDAVERIVDCKPEGVPRAKSIASIADLSQTGMWSSTVNIDFPPIAVSGSERLEVSASGNVLASVFDGLEELMRMPYGCGEQNMLNFAPNIFLLQFYITTGTLTSEVKDKAVRYMLAGYMKENQYQHEDGGYSTFGPGDRPASTWLTAFVMKCYAQAEQQHHEDDSLVAIDRDVMAKGLNFLISKQSKDGSYVEAGVVFHKEMQGASAEEGVALTAYTLIGMYESHRVFQNGNDTFSLKMTELIENSIEMATNYLSGKLNTLTDSYDICVTTYALTLVDATTKETAFNLMESKAIINGNGKYWARPSPPQEERYHWSATTDSINIEMTAYALLVYSLRPNAVSNGLPVLRWLTQNKGPNAGFYSTQDTIIGLQALSVFGAELYSDEDIPMKMTVEYQDADGNDLAHEFLLNKENELLLQIARINYTNNAPKELNLKVQTVSGGKGPNNAVVETTLRYNVLEKVNTKKYILSFNLTQTNNGFSLDINVKAPAGEKRSMSILAVEKTPGYTPELDLLEKAKNVSRVEDKEGFINIYYDSDVIDSEGVSVRAQFLRAPSGALTKPKPRTIKVYDYYSPQYEASQTYQLTQVPNSEFCSAVPGAGACVVVQNGNS